MHKTIPKKKNKLKPNTFWILMTLMLVHLLENTFLLVIIYFLFIMSLRNEYIFQVSVHAIWKRIQNFLYCFWSSNLKCTLGLLYWKELHHLRFVVCWICIMPINLSECKQICTFNLNHIDTRFRPMSIYTIDVHI